MMATRASRNGGKRRPLARRAAKVAPGIALQWNPRVACRTLDGTAFILLNSRMLRLNEVGTYIWERFESGATLARVIDGILAEFDTTPARAKTDAQAFVEELVAKEVLVPITSRSRARRSS